MKCPSCGFTTFDEAIECKKCGLSFGKSYAPKDSLGLKIPFDKLQYAPSTKNSTVVPEKKTRIGILRRSIALFIDLNLTLICGLVISIIIPCWASLVKGSTAWTILQEINKAVNELINRISGARPEAILGIIIGIIATSLLVNLIFTLVYNLIEGLTGASPGKRIMKIKIGNTNGSRANIIKLLLRYLIKNISLICLLIAIVLKNNLLYSLSQIIGVIIIFGCLSAFGKRKQALHDMLAGTAVFSKTSLT